MSAAVSEAVARIIDPAAFLFTDDEIGQKGIAAKAEAFEKAERILAALQEGSGALPASPSGGHEKAWLEEAWLTAEAQLSEVSAAIGTCRFMDLPDGGSPSLALQVRRMRSALDTAETALAKYEDPSEMGMEPKAECAQPNQPRDREEG